MVGLIPEFLQDNRDAARSNQTSLAAHRDSSRTRRRKCGLGGFESQRKFLTQRRKVAKKNTESLCVFFATLRLCVRSLLSFLIQVTRGSFYTEMTRCAFSNTPNRIPQLLRGSRWLRKGFIDRRRRE